MDPNDEQTAPGAEANTAPSPGATDGASSSDAAAEAPESSAEAILREFQEKYGDDEPEETGESYGEEEPSGDDAPDADAAEAEQDPKPEDSAASAETDDDDDTEFRIPDDEFKALPDGVRKRLGHLNTRAKKAERELAQRDKEMVPLKDAHERFTQLQTFVRENQIEPKNVTLAFNAMALLSKGDYQGFLDSVGPWYEHAQQAVGKSISPDLQQRVDDGYLTMEDAQELTRARVQSQVHQSKAQNLTEQQKLRDQEAVQQRNQQDMLAAINAREAEWKSSDPDYAQKSPEIQSMVEFAMKGGAVPKDAASALALMDDAYARVSSKYKRPAPKPTPPRPTASNSPRGNPPPETTKDAIYQALRDFPQT